MAIYSLKIEKHVLGGLIRNQEVFADINNFINENDFFHEVHSTIFCVIKNILNKGEKIDKVLLAQRIKDLGITFKDEIDVFEYIEGISFTQITPKATEEAAQELVKFRIRREIEQTALNIQAFVKSPGDKPISEIISLADAMYNEKISAFSFDEGPQDLFDDVERIIEEFGNNPQDEVGFKTPHVEFNRMFGGYKNGNVYAVVSRPSEGKTTFLTNTAFKMSELNKAKVLYLDTEMDTIDQQIRMVSSLTDIPAWYLESGNWRKNQEMTTKVRAAWPLIKKSQFYHFHVRNRSTEDIASIIRRWKMSKVGRENQCMVVYDYIKLTNEKMGQGTMETQIIGQKVDILKTVAEEIKAPLLTAMQMNRSGENFSKKSHDVTDDSSAIATSDRLLWFATNVGIFRRKIPNELAEDGEQFGTHKYINLKGRFQGREAAGHSIYVKVPISKTEFKFVPNYINYNIENFRVEEKGSLKDVLDYRAKKFNIQPDADSADLI